MIDHTLKQKITTLTKEGFNLSDIMNILPGHPSTITAIHNQYQEELARKNLRQHNLHSQASFAMQLNN